MLQLQLQSVCITLHGSVSGLLPYACPTDFDAGHQPSQILIGPNGRGQEGGHIEFGPDETNGTLQISLQAGKRFIARGTVPVQDLWQVSMYSQMLEPFRAFCFGKFR